MDILKVDDLKSLEVGQSITTKIETIDVLTGAIKTTEEKSGTVVSNLNGHVTIVFGFRDKISISAKDFKQKAKTFVKYTPKRHVELIKS